MSELGKGSAGVWTRSQAKAALSSSGVDALLRRGVWQQLLPGVYTDAGHAPDATQLAWASVLASGEDAIACGRTAARLWSLPLIDDLDPATGAADHHNHEVAVRRNVGALRVGQPQTAVVHRRQLLLAEDDVTRDPSGLRVTTPARTLRDLAGVLTLEALVCTLDDALRRGLVDAEQLQALVMGAKGSRHVQLLTAAVDLTDPGAATPAESLARLLLRPYLPNLRCQVPVRDDWGELIAVLDLADEELMLAVEVDGKRGHAGAQMVAKDRRRDRRTGSRGWHTERVTWFETRRRQAEVVHRVTAVARELSAARHGRATHRA